MEKTVLNEYLGDQLAETGGTCFEETIDNLKALLKDMAALPKSANILCASSLFQVRRALVSLETLAATMKG